MPLHPLGSAHLARLLAMAALSPPCRILDMGAGKGESLGRLLDLGFDAVGIDLRAEGAVSAGDFLHCPFPAASFDAVLSECAFFVSGDVRGALREAARLVRPGGKLLLGDVCFLCLHEWEALLGDTGFRLLQAEDQSAAWKQYYLESIWEGRDIGSGSFPKGKCRYYLTVCERRNTDGTL